MTEEGEVSCARCGTPRTLDLNSPGQSPCPECGHSGVAYQLGVATETDAAVAAGVKVSTDRERSASDRWRQARDGLASVRAVQTSQPNLDALRGDLHNVYVNLWSLKEACERAGIPTSAVQRAIRADANIARAMDLGNAEKHGTPLVRPWSGDQPKFGRVEIQSDNDHAWTFDERVFFAGSEESGVRIAHAAMTAWGERLRVWGLV